MTSLPPVPDPGQPEADAEAAPERRELPEQHDPHDPSHPSDLHDLHDLHDDERPDPLRTAQTAAAWSAGVFGLLGFLASVGVLLVPAGAAWLAWLLHPLLLALGAAGAYAAALRGREIDRWRWRMVEDPLITDAEREEAHKEAERQRRAAATAFLAAPVFLGYWLVYQVTGDLAVWLLPASALLGYAAGVALAHRWVPEEPWT